MYRRKESKRERRVGRQIKYGIMEAITDWLHCDERYEKTRWCEQDTRIRALKDAYLWWEMRVEMRLSTSTQGFSSYTVSKKALATKWQHQIETKKLNQRLYWVKLSTVVLIGWQRPLKNLLTLGTWFYNNLCLCNQAQKSFSQKQTLRKQGPMQN